MRGATLFRLDQEYKGKPPMRAGAPWQVLGLNHPRPPFKVPLVSCSTCLGGFPPLPASPGQVVLLLYRSLTSVFLSNSVSFRGSSCWGMPSNCASPVHLLSSRTSNFLERPFSWQIKSLDFSWPIHSFEVSLSICRPSKTNLQEEVPQADVAVQPRLGFRFFVFSCFFSFGTRETEIQR